jgi:curved DNA-binding protein CbpA
MADRTLYEILEVSETASQDTIRAAWDRLSAKWDPDRSPIADPEARTQYAPIKEAYLTLGNPDKRAAYDRKLAAAWQTTVHKPASSFPKFALIAVAALAIGGYYFNGKREQAQLDAAKAVAAAKAKEAEAHAKAQTDVELASIEDQRLRREKATEERARRQREIDLARFGAERRFDETKASIDEQRDRILKQRAEMQEKREEMQAAAAARQQLAREKAELCRMERARYGRAVSC